MSAGYIYILCVREFITTGQNIYKIGMTRNIVRRTSQYPKGSELICTHKTDNVQCVERYLIKKFAEDFIHRKDIGSEYFQGNLKSMIATIYNYIMSNMPDDATPTALQKANLFESSDIVIKYIDELRSELSYKTVKSDDAYDAFLKWATDKNYFHNVTNATFAKELKSLFGVKKDLENNSKGVYFSLVFPNLMPHVREIDDNLAYVERFVEENIVKDDNGYITLAQAESWFRRVSYYKHGPFGGHLQTILGVPVIRKKEIDGVMKSFVFEGYSFKCDKN